MANKTTSNKNSRSNRSKSSKLGKIKFPKSKLSKLNSRRHRSSNISPSNSSKSSKCSFYESITSVISVPKQDKGENSIKSNNLFKKKVSFSATNRPKKHIDTGTTIEQEKLVNLSSIINQSKSIKNKIDKEPKCEEMSFILPTTEYKTSFSDFKNVNSGNNTLLTKSRKDSFLRLNKSKYKFKTVEWTTLTTKNPKTMGSLDKAKSTHSNNTRCTLVHSSSDKPCWLDQPTIVPTMGGSSLTLGPESQEYLCPGCARIIKTEIKPTPGVVTWISCILISCCW